VGQFFIYQGFNNRTGWMHTSSAVDATDEYLETVIEKGGKWFYKFGTEERPVVTEHITVPYKTASGMRRRRFTVFRTHTGPWCARRRREMGQLPDHAGASEALTQSYTRTKAKNYKEFKQTMELHTNSSNDNTIYADADGNIAYFHANFIPRRDPKFDWRQPVDGSDSATGVEGTPCRGREPEPLQSRERVAVQHEQLAVVGGGPEQPEAGGLPEVRRQRR